MIPKKGTLKFLRGEAAWVIYTSNNNYIRVHRRNIKALGLKKNNHYYQTLYHFNIFGDLCVWVAEHSFCLDKSVDYEVLYTLTTENSSN
jgi:hypothetical protein